MTSLLWAVKSFRDSERSFLILSFVAMGMGMRVKANGQVWRSAFLSFLLTVNFLAISNTYGWSPPELFAHRRRRFLGTKYKNGYNSVAVMAPLRTTSQGSQEWGNETGPEKSQMTNYVLEFLRKNAGEDDGDGEASNESRHNTHLVAIPMENCHQLMLELESIQRAILYHCPLLVHSCIPQATTRLPLLYVAASDKSSATTSKLFAIVNEEVTRALNPNSGADIDTGPEEPLVLRFESLDIEGNRNNALHAVAKTESSTRLLDLIKGIQQRIHEETGWKTELPPDPNSDAFRPRVPFMRLPRNWDEILAEEHGEKFEEGVLTADEGGNGISPILWFKWEQDDFGDARMREIAVYQVRDNYEGMYNEQAFYLPSQSAELPMGGENMTKQEMEFQNYQNQRMAEAEQFLQSDGNEIKPNDQDQDDIVSQMTRNRLEALSPTPDRNNVEDKANLQENDSIPVESSEPKEIIDDWTRARMDDVIASRAVVKSQNELARKIKKPPIEENEIFARYKNGTLLPKAEEETVEEILPSFPSREYCFGFWRVLASPTGFDVEEGDSSHSDNLILRVDGTTAGGPILDQETRQKASGGTWRLMEAGGEEDPRLLIRLVIPPKKERVLVMEGGLQRTSLSSQDFSFAGSSFRIPQVEKRKELASSSALLEDLVHCTGNVWIEDAITKANKQDIGTFSLVKINTPRNPDSYTITVPRPVRNQD